MVDGHDRRCPSPPRPDPGRCLQGFVRPGAEVLAITPQADEVPAQVEDRARVLPLIRDVPGGRVAHREPRLDVAVREAALARPLHRRPPLVPARVLGPVALADGVLEPVAGDVDVRHADLVPVIEQRRAAQREQDHERRTRPTLVAVAPPRHEPAGVVVGAVPERPRAGGERPLGPFHDFPHLRSRGREDERHVEGEMQLVLPAPVEARQRLEVEHPGLAEQHAPRVVPIGDRPPPPDHIVRLGPVHAEVRAQTVAADAGMVRVEGRRIVPEGSILDEGMCDVDPEPRDPSVEPEPQEVVERVGDARVPPVQVRLLRQEVVEVVLLGRLVPGPRGATEGRSPVVRR